MTKRNSPALSRGDCETQRSARRTIFWFHFRSGNGTRRALRLRFMRADSIRGHQRRTFPPIRHTAPQTFAAASALRRRLRRRTASATTATAEIKQVGMSEDHPPTQSTRQRSPPTSGSHLTVEADHDQPLRRNEGSRRAATGPAEVRRAAQSNRKSQRRWKRGQPAPARRARQFYRKAKPLRQHPEPQGEECRPYCEWGQSRRPGTTSGGHPTFAVALTVCSS
jgi:hypothetical protein